MGADMYVILHWFFFLINMQFFFVLMETALKLAPESFILQFWAWLLSMEHLSSLGLELLSSLILSTDKGKLFFGT
jgi:type IV secretory pathway TrbL component